MHAKRITMWSCAVLALGLIAQSFLIAADEPKKADEPKVTPKKQDGAQGYYAIIAKELKLTDEQKKALDAGLNERNAELKKWDDANGAKVSELTAAEKKAKEAGEAETAKKIGADLKTLRAARTAIEDSGRAKLQAVLTPEQKTHLNGYTLYTTVLARLSAAMITDEQKVKVKALSLEAGKTITAETDEKGRTAIRNTLTAKVTNDVLTEEQRTALVKAAADKKGKSTQPKVTPAGDKPVEKPAEK